MLVMSVEMMVMTAMAIIVIVKIQVCVFIALLFLLFITVGCFSLWVKPWFSLLLLQS